MTLYLQQADCMMRLKYDSPERQEYRALMIWQAKFDTASLELQTVVRL